MTITKLNDVIEPVVFTNYITQNTMAKTNLVESGLLAKNEVIQRQITAGAHSFSVPMWLDLADTEANISDDSDNKSTPNGITAAKMVVRKASLNNSWGAANFASEMAGSSAIDRIQDRVKAYWERQIQKRLIASLNGVLAANVASNDGDMVLDISNEADEAAAKFSAAAVIDAAGTLGDSLDQITTLFVHGDVYRSILKQDLIESVLDSNGSLLYQTFRGLMLVQDDGLPKVDGVYTSVLAGAGAFGYAVSAPEHADGTEIESQPSQGNGAGATILHSRINLGLHPHGFSFVDGSVVTGESPTIANLSNADCWDRVVERKAVKLAFLVSKI